jgi:hypothetical protein
MPGDHAQDLARLLRRELGALVEQPLRMGERDVDLANRL